MIKLGSNNIGKIYLGSNSIGKAYLGSNLVFQKGSSPTPPSPPSLIYSISSSITTQNYDTGVKLFDTPKSFTILCEATYNNYNWTGTTRTQGLYGISTGGLFRFGAVASVDGYTEDAVVASNTNYYSALVMNDTSSGNRATALYSRYNGNQTRRWVVTYDHTIRKVFATEGTLSDRWYIVPGNLISDNTLKLLIGNATGTISKLDIYNGVLDGTAIDNFIAGN